MYDGLENAAALPAFLALPLDGLSPWLFVHGLHLALALLTLLAVIGLWWLRWRMARIELRPSSCSPAGHGSAGHGPAGRSSAGHGIASGATPRVSIHVPISSEPPALVIRTLDALARLDYPSYEVLVLDNNTPDRELWEPVAVHCEQLDRGSTAPFRFFRAPRLEGFKAGALERCRRLMDPAAELIFVVDADYRVLPGVLDAAVAELQHSAAAFVQLPQAYDAEPFPASVLEDELGTFFSTYAGHAQERSAMLPTGTLLLVRRQALEQVGGWHSTSITEDADLGRRLLASGQFGSYLPRVGGRGDLPGDWKSLLAQRRRWAAGNLQVAAKLLASPRGLAAVHRRGALAAVGLQLSAWLSPLLLPAVFLVLTAPLAPDSPWRAGAALWSLVVMAEVLGTVAFYGRALLPRSPMRRLAAALLHLALARVQTLAMLGAFLPSGRVFVRTDKFRHAMRGRGQAGLVLGAVLLAAAGLHLRAGTPAAALGAFVLALVAWLEPAFALEWRWSQAARRRPAGGLLEAEPPWSLATGKPEVRS